MENKISTKDPFLKRYAAVFDSKLALSEDAELNRNVMASQSRLRVLAKSRRLKWFLGFVLLTIATTSTIFLGRFGMSWNLFDHDGRLQPDTLRHHLLCNEGSSRKHPAFTAAEPWAGFPVNARKVKDRSNWNPECSSKLDLQHNCSLAIDDRGAATDWRSADGGTHWIIIDLKTIQKVHSVAVTPSNNFFEDGGSVRQHLIEIAIKKGEWQLVALGTWREWADVNYATFEPREAQYIRLTVIDTAQNQKFVAISDVNIYVVDKIPTVKTNGGRWNLTLDFPIVPVTAFLDPTSHELITMSSSSADKFGRAPSEPKDAITLTATWNPRRNTIREKLVQQEGHDMFCPGTSFDDHGLVTITGGVSPWAFSIYSPVTRTWSMLIDTKTNSNKTLNYPRGYHGQTFLSNGSTFVIGGTWSGGEWDKDGEIYDPKTQNWTVLSNIKAEYIKMDVVEVCKPVNQWDPCRKTEWRQHHPWLFAWKDDSIFHAGPSKKMNWFFYKPENGSRLHAGYRTDTKAGFADGDAVCAITSMYDAAKGAILIAGGAPNYHYWLRADDPGGRDPNNTHRANATNNAFEIQLGSVKPGTTVSPKKLNSMNHQRIFANSVILPNGETLVIGGQAQGEPFYDDTWQPVPEIYSPSAGTWREVTQHSTPRVYHSWALLLPDASVICGGGGLSSGHPPTNHYDAQIYQPAYFFQSDGKTLATRPKISAKDKGVYKLGEKIKVTTDTEIDDASLIRYSAATHALNNDLRRVKLTPVADGPVSGKKYTLEIPREPGVTLPGYYMLFVLKNGIPSVSETVQVLAS